MLTMRRVIIHGPEILWMFDMVGKLLRKNGQDEEFGKWEQS
jgi:hypothetical protein